MTHTHTPNNPVYQRNVRVAKLKELKTRMERLNFSKIEIIDKLTNTCLFKWNLTSRSANDYVKVAMMSIDDRLESLLEYKEKLLETN